MLNRPRDYRGVVAALVVCVGIALDARGEGARVREEGDYYVIENGSIGVKAPSRARPREAPGPIAGVRVGEGKWVGGSEWRASVWCHGFQAKVISAGPKAAEVELLYFFVNYGEAGRVPYAAVNVRLNEGESVVRISESHDMTGGDHWVLALGGREDNAPIFKGRIGVAEVESLKVERVEKDAALVSVDEGEGQWVGVRVGGVAVGIMGVGAEKWEHRIENRIVVWRRRSGEVEAVLPASRGSRRWVMGVGEKEGDVGAAMGAVSRKPADN